MQVGCKTVVVVVVGFLCYKTVNERVVLID